MKNIFQDLKRKDHKRYLGGLDVFKYIGPGLLVTVGFIDPGNWASNFAAGSEFGYSLLWVVTLSTIMLIVLQHNVAHLGIVTGLCLSEAATKYTPKWVSRPILGTAVLASISTSLAEILGGAIALQMLLDIPIIWGSVLTTVFVSIMLFTNSYKKIERAIIAFVSVIGLSFIYELFLVRIDWPVAVQGWVTPSFPQGSMLIIMSVLGAVVMPHNLFLHSEVIQSHEYNKQDDTSIRRVLKYELFDTLFSMIVGCRFHLCRYLRRVVPHQGQPFAGGGNPVVGHRAAVDLFYRRPVQGTADFADDTEHPVAVYGVPPGEPHLVPQSDGAVCEQ